jgi:Skp family chaperone for outer membrane proteins
MSQEEVANSQKAIQDKSKDLEFIVGKIQAKQNETAEKIFRDMNPSLQKILSELLAAKQIKTLLGRDTVIFADPALDITDDVTSMLDVAAASGADE